MNRPDGVYLGIVDLDTLIYYVNYILKNGIYEIGVDTETDSLDYLNCNILGISLAFKMNSNYESSKNNFGLYIPIRREIKQDVLWDNPSDYLSLEEIIPILNLLFDNTGITKVFHNAKFDLHILERQGFVISNPIFDTMIGAWVLGNVHGGKYGLKHLTKEKLGFDQLSFNEVVGKKGTFENVDLATAVAYAGPDGDMTLRLANLEYKVIEKYPSLRKTLYLELNAIRVLKDMEEHGALIDVEYLRRTSRDLGKQMRHYEERVKGFLGNININSEQQLKEVLRKKLGVDLDNVTKGTIEKLSQESEELKDILAYRERAKLKSVYCDGLIKLVDKNNYLHTDYYQMLKTGRISSSAPNLQNIPTKKEGTDLPLIRRAFIAPPGYKFVCIDYSQLELRVITHVSGEQYWIDAFKNNEDIHASTAAAVNHIPLDEVTKYMRRKAKCVGGESIVLIEGVPTKIQNLDFNFNGGFKDYKKITTCKNTTVGIKNTYYDGKKRLYNIITNRGVITCTNRHRLLTKTGYLSLEDGLVVGDEIEKLNLFEVGDFPYNPIRFKYNDRVPETYIFPTHKLAYLAGLFIGDGCVSSHNVGICHGNREITDIYGYSYNDWANTIENSCKSAGFAPYTNTNMVVLGSRHVISYLEQLELVKENHRNLRIPSWILSSGKTAILNFVAGLIDTDGWVDKYGKGWLCTKDPILAGQVCAALSYCNINPVLSLSYNKIYNKDYYKIHVSAADTEIISKFMLHSGKLSRVQTGKINKYITTVHKIIKIEEHEVTDAYDLEIDSSEHAYDVNGITTHNTVNFGLLYGESAYGLSRREGMTEAEAQEFIDEYFKVLPAIKNYVFSRKEMVVKQGYTETFNGRRLYFKVDKNDKRAVAAAQREGINFPIQGGASDIVKKAMFEVWNYLKPHRTKMILQVHDEIDFLMPEEEMDIVIPDVVNIMSSVFRLNVDLKVDVEVGQNWNDIEDWK